MQVHTRWESPVAACFQNVALWEGSLAVASGCIDIFVPSGASKWPTSTGIQLPRPYWPNHVGRSYYWLAQTDEGTCESKIGVWRLNSCIVFRSSLLIPSGQAGVSLLRNGGSMKAPSSNNRLFTSVLYFESGIQAYSSSSLRLRLEQTLSTISKVFKQIDGL
jgi:hypothetical protein